MKNAFLTAVFTAAMRKKQGRGAGGREQEAKSELAPASADVLASVLDFEICSQNIL